jgi:hypothetical protein
MPSLYKYLPEKYADDFMSKGAILFRSISYFRDYEDAQVRGDEFEGTRLYKPQGRLETTITKTQQKVVLPHAMESSANEGDIFVYCLSTILSAELAMEFKADICIEIRDPSRLIGGIRAALKRRASIKNKMLVHGEVKYYTPEEPPIVDWALPERIAMSKLQHYKRQQEYRIAFSVNDAFRVENTRLKLVLPGSRRPERATAHPERLIKIGRISKQCKIHRFK